MAVREDLILDITRAQRSVDALEAQVSSAFSGISVTVDTAGIAGEITTATEAADTNVRVTADTAGIAAEISEATDVGATTVDVKADTSTARREVRSLDGDLAKANATASKLGALLTGAALVAGARGLFALAEASSAVHEQVTGSEVVFGQLATGVQKFADQADRIGLANSQALQLVNNFGQLARSADLSGDAVSDFATTIVERGADIASLRDIDLDQTLDALRSGLVGETEPLRNIGIFMNEALVQSKAYELGIANLGDELTDAQKIQARYSIILEQSEIAAGNFALTADGLANTQRQVSAELKNLAAEAGSALEPTILDLAAAAREDLIPALGELAEKALPPIGSLLEDLAPVLGITLDLLIAATPLLELTADVIGAIPAPLIAVVGGYLALNRAQRLIKWSAQTEGATAARESLEGLRVGFTRLNAATRGGAGVAGVAALGVAIGGVIQAGGGETIGDLAGSLIELADSFTGFASGRTKRVGEEIEEIIGALDVNTTSGSLAATQKLIGAFNELDEVKRVTLGGTHITAFGSSAEESARFDQIQEQIKALQGQARAEIEAGLATGRFTDEQVGAARVQVLRFDTAEQIIRQLQVLEGQEARSAEQAKLTIDKYDDVARAYVGVADALGRLRTAAPDVESAISRIRTSGDTSESSFLNLAVAIDTAGLSADQMDDAAAGLGITSEALSGFVDKVTTSLEDFITTAVDGLPTVSTAFEAARSSAENQASSAADEITERAAERADAIVKAADDSAQAVLDAASEGNDAAKHAAQDRADGIRENAQDQADAIRESAQKQADAVADGAKITAAGLTEALNTAAVDLGDFHADLRLLTERGFADLAGLIAGQGQEAGDALADELAAALEGGHTEILDGLRAANQAFEDETQATLDFITNDLAPQFLSAAGLISSAITESFGENLDFEEKVRIAAELAKAELDPQGEAIAAIAATKGEKAARSYGQALKLPEETVNAGVKAGLAIAGIDTRTFVSSGRRIGQEIGNGIVDGFTAALLQRQTEVSDKAAQLVLAAELAAKRAGRISSPSRVWEEIGGFLGAGLVAGISASVPAVSSAGGTLVASAVPSFGVREFAAGGPAGGRLHPEDIAALASAIGAMRPNEIFSPVVHNPVAATSEASLNREYRSMKNRYTP